MFKVAFVAISGLFLLLGCQTTEKVYDPKYVKLSEKNASDCYPKIMTSHKRTINLTVPKLLV